MLHGTILLSDALSAEPDTHSIDPEARTEGARIYTGVQIADREAAHTYNNWLILARRTGDASTTIYLWIITGVDASMRRMIVAYAGDSHKAFLVIKEMYD